MAGLGEAINISTPLKRFFGVIRLEKREISSIYFYAILSGLIQLSLPLGIQAIINFAQVAAGRSQLPTSMWLLIVLVLVGVFMAGVLQVNQMKVVEKIQQRLFARYALEFTYKIPKLNLGAVQDSHLPELVNRFFDTVSLQKGISKLLLDIPLALIQILFGLILLSFYSSIFIIFGIILIVILYLVLYYTSQRGYDASIRESNYKYSVAGWLQDVAKAITSFKFHEKNNLHLRKTDALVSGYLGARTEHFHVLKFQYWSLIFFKLLITASMLVVGGILLVEQVLNIGQFIAAEIVIITVLSAVEKMILNLDNVFDLLTSIEKLGKVTDKEIETGGQLNLDPKGNGLSISANNLGFSYGDKKILNDISFEIYSNEKVCIVGDESTAKSALLNLLSGSLHEFNGKLAINSIPIANYSIDSLRSCIGIYAGNNEIFNGSLWNNISMGSVALQTDEMKDVLNNVGLSKFFASLEKGFDTILLTDGKGLSEDSIKKILLARAIVGKPSLLLLDNFENAIHGDEKKSIHQMIIGLDNTTTIAVSNDPSFYMQCNKIIHATNSGSRFFDSPTEFANYYREVLK
jgi:ABC-type bacteriocin/lantibiotic exporter with double-glycine peptidase domain